MHKSNEQCVLDSRTRRVSSLLVSEFLEKFFLMKEPAKAMYNLTLILLFLLSLLSDNGCSSFCLLPWPVPGLWSSRPSHTMSSQSLS